MYNHTAQTQYVEIFMRTKDDLRPKFFKVQQEETSIKCANGMKDNQRLYKKLKKYEEGDFLKNQDIIKRQLAHASASMKLNRTGFDCLVNLWDS